MICTKDEERVEEVVSTKLRANNYASALPSNSSATGADQASHLDKMDARTRAVKVDKFHIPRRVQEAAP